MSETDVDESDRVVPFLTAPVWPRKTIRQVAGSTSATTILFLFSSVGLAQVLALVIDGPNVWQDFPDLLLVLLSAGILGLLGMCLMALLTGTVGRLLGGRASNREVFAAFAWGVVPLCWIVPIVGAGLFLTSQDHTALVSQSALVLLWCASLWSIVTTIIMIIEVERFGAVRAATTYAIGWIVVGVLVAVSIRSFLWQPFNITSAAQRPTLLVGDHLFVSKYVYGYSRFSFPFNPPLFEGRIFGCEPKRGDVIVFKLPRDNNTDYIKRVIGLPGDTIELRSGQLFINEEPVPRRRVEDYVLNGKNGKQSIPQYEETLPNQVSYRVLEMLADSHFDNVGPYRVPDGHYFVVGDNRDNSNDSRGSVGMVPFENLVGRAEIIYLSISRDASNRAGRVFGLVR